MDFQTLLAALGDGDQPVSVSQDWSQGRAGFGGLMAALLYEAMRRRLARQGLGDRPVRSLAISFVAPAAVEVPTNFEVEVLRSGKSVVSVLGRATQNGETVTLVQGSFGAPRTSRIGLTAMPAPEVTPPNQCFNVGYRQGVTPEYLQHLTLAWGIGGLPYSDTPSPAIGGWVRLEGEKEVMPLDEARVLALVDAWPPALLPHLAGPAAGSTLSWTIEFVQPVPTLAGDAWYKYRAIIEHAADGYGHTSAALWTADDQLLAISRQTVTVFG